MPVTLECEVVTRKTYPVVFTEHELILKVYNSWLSTKKCIDRDIKFTPSYVNDKGQYEHWVDTGHGSGIKYTQDMPKSDIPEYTAFKTLINRLI